MNTKVLSKLRKDAKNNVYINYRKSPYEKNCKNEYRVHVVKDGCYFTSSSLEEAKATCTRLRREEVYRQLIILKVNRKFKHLNY